MHLWFVNHYATAPPESIGRHYRLAWGLQQRGHQVTIISTSFQHKRRIETRLQPGEAFRHEMIEGVRFVWLRSPPYNGNTVGRLWNLLVFAGRVWRQCGLRQLRRPDAIVGSSPDLFAATAAYLLARRYAVPYLLEIRDLWPETLVSLGRMSRWHPLVVTMGFLENYLYRNSDRVLSLLPGAHQYIAGRGGQPEKIHWLPNGVDLTCVPPLTAPRDNNRFTVIFAGAHGAANGLDIVLDAAHCLLNNPGGENIVVRLVGDGPEKPRLQARAQRENLTNVEFCPLVSHHKMYEMLQAADACLMVLESSPVFEWGISPKKLFDYFACGRPVIFCVSTGFNPVAEADAGVVARAGDPRALAEAILRVASLPEAERVAMGKRGREYVETRHDIAMITDKLDFILRDVTGEATSVEGGLRKTA